MQQNRKVFINKEEYDTKIKRLETLGIDPVKLKKHNKCLFNAIIMKMQIDGNFSNPSNSDQLWWTLGNKELFKKFEKEEKLEERTEDDVKKQLDKLKKPSGKKNQIGKFRKK